MEREEMMEVLGEFREGIVSEVKSIVSPKEKPKEKPKEETSSLSPDDPHFSLVSQIVSAIEEKNKASADEIYKTMFNDHLATITASYPAFGEYLKSKDDFGDIILDRINGIKDYSERVQALQKLFKNYAAAQGSNSQDIRLTEEAKKKVEESKEKREELKKQFFKGDLDLDQFTEQFFGSLDKQIEEIRGRGD